MKNMRLVCTVILILPLLALTTSADDRDYDEVLVLMKTVEKKILDFENSRKTDVTARINRIEQDVESIRSDTNANNIVINDFTTEIRSLMAGLKQSIDENNQPNATDKTNNPDKAEDIDSGDIRVYWKNGINMETRDKKVTFRIGARIMNDWTFFSPETKLADTLGDFNGGTEIRRAWIQASGLVGGNIEYNAIYGLQGGGVEILDLYIGVCSIPVAGNIRVGHFKEPMGFEQLMSCNNLFFIERSYNHTLVPFRNTGVMVQNYGASGRLTWAAGIFRDADKYGNSIGKERYNTTARISALPIWSNDGYSLIHIGASISKRNPLNDTIRYRSYAETHLGPRIVDTFDIDADDNDLLNAELASKYGRFAFLGEYIRSHIGVIDSGEIDVSSYYILGSFFLTGNHRTYSQKTGAFGGTDLKQEKSFGAGGYGAWEAVARMSFIDLDDGFIKGGNATDLSLGINWYLNPNTRIMWNYIHADLEDTAATDNFLMRFQFNM